MKSAKEGKVWLLGAGPGDPELLTLKALRVLQRAELILFDHLVSAEIRALFPKNVPAFYVGKKKGDHSIAQQDLNALLIRQARAGKTVCRVKCGDPFVFGRGGEELLALRNAGVDAEVVAGITAAAGCSSAAGIPLTHRGLSQGCTFITGQAETTLSANWRALASLGHTLVFYMGISQIGLIEQNLLAAGMSGSVPAALIENGCKPTQRVVTGTVSGLRALAESHQICSPALIVIGQVVSLADVLGGTEWATDLQRLTA